MTAVNQHRLSFFLFVGWIVYIPHGFAADFLIDSTPEATLSDTSISKINTDKNYVNVSLSTPLPNIKPGELANNVKIPYVSGTNRDKFKPSNSTQPISGDLRKFILLGYFHLAEDILRGEGQHLSALFELLNIEESHQDQQMIVLRSFLVTQHSLFSFSNKVINFYIN